MNFYLGLIKYRPNTTWFEIHKLIRANSVEEARKKLTVWADKNVPNEDKIVIVTETL